MPSTLTNLIYHIVFSTKHRAPLIAPEIKEELFRYMGGIIRDEGGVQLEINGMPDHVHVLAKLKPSISVSDMLRLLKANSSKWMNEQPQNRNSFGWQDGYGAFTVSTSQIEPVADYIRNQETHHQQHDFKAEFVALLKRHEIEYDERYLWD